MIRKPRDQPRGIILIKIKLLTEEFQVISFSQNNYLKMKLLIKKKDLSKFNLTPDDENRRKG